MGDEREQTGQLLSSDNGEAVIKMDNGTIEIYPMNYLCKMVD